MDRMETEMVVLGDQGGLVDLADRLDPEGLEALRARLDLEGRLDQDLLVGLDPLGALEGLENLADRLDQLDLLVQLGLEGLVDQRRQEGQQVLVGQQVR